METVTVGKKKPRIGLVIVLFIAAVIIAGSLIFLTTSEMGAELSQSLGADKVATSIKERPAQDFTAKDYSPK